MTSVEILYVSAVASDREFQAMKDARHPGVQEVTYGMPESGHKFHTLVQAGLVADPQRRVLSLVGRSLHPAFYAGRFWKRRRETVRDNLAIDHLSVVNVRVVKQIWLAVAFLINALAWRVRTRGAPERILVVDAAYVSVLPSLWIALAGSRVKKIAIFCDVYSYMAEVSDANSSSGPLRAFLSKVVAALYRRLDGFVLLTEQMNAVVNPAGRPHMVMEGLVDAEMERHENQIEDKYPNPTLLYSGALRKQYGLDWLIDGFRAYQNPDAKLLVYGGGDYAPNIEEAAAADPRIRYAGTVPNAEVVREQERAWLLVNPRPTDHEFTQLSFPSKVMEYMASGTAVLTTRLPGMPAEYLDYVFTIDGSGPEAVEEALQRVISVGLNELHARGSADKAFVLTEKNNVRQAQRIVDFARAC